MRKQPPRELTGLVSPLNPRGNNNSDSKTIFNERFIYRDALLPLFPFMENNYKNFWGENYLYGKVNLLSDPIMPRPDQLKQLRYSKEGTSLYAINFVADAWRDLAEKLRDLTTNEIFFSNSPWAEPLAVRAYDSPEAYYSNYMDEVVYPVFSSVYMNTLDNNPVVYTRDRHLKTFSDYLFLFSDYYNRILSEVGNLTLSSVIESPTTPPNLSGLVIEISDTPHDQDRAKFLNFMLDENFGLFQDIVHQYGFSIDPNAPWRLVADLQSQAMREYMKGVPSQPVSYPLNKIDDCGTIIPAPLVEPREAYGFSQLEGMENIVRHAEGYGPYKAMRTDSDNELWFHTIFSYSYQETRTLDLDVLRGYLIKFYNDYVGLKPLLSFQSQNYCLTSPAGVVSEAFLYRRKLVEESVLSPGGRYGDRWAIRTYFNLRRTEKGINLTSQQQYIALREAFNIYDFHPGNSAIKLEKALKFLQDDYLRGNSTQPLTIRSVGDIINQS